MLPIEQVRLQVHAGRGGGWIKVSNEPVAIVVCNALLHWHALAGDGSPMELDALRDRVPGLVAWLVST